MQGIIWTPQTVNARLQQYRERMRDIELSSERLESLLDQAHGLGAARLDGMPRSQSKPKDRLGGLIAQICEVEDVIAEDLESLRAEREVLETAIRQMGKAERRAVLRLRYFDALSWADVNNVIFGGLADYADKEESYLRRTMKSHKTALSDLAEILNQQNQQKNEKEI